VIVVEESVNQCIDIICGRYRAGIRDHILAGDLDQSGSACFATGADLIVSIGIVARFFLWWGVALMQSTLR